MLKSRVCASLAIAITALSTSVFAQAPAAGVEAGAPAPDKVLAVVGGEEITETQLSAAIQSMLRGQTPPPEAMPEIRESILDSLIDNCLITQFIAAKKIEVSQEKVEETITDIKQSVSQAGADFAVVLQSQGMTEADLRERIATELAFQTYAESEVTDAKAQEYFKSRKQGFDGSEVKASHILLAYDETSTAEEKAAAKKKIAAIRAEIVAGGDFAASAKTHSACPSGQSGGDLGFFGRYGGMVEPFAAAAFDLKVAEMSQPVETEFGVHLIKVTELKPGEGTFEEVKENVRNAMMSELLKNTAAQQRKVTKIKMVN